MAVPVPIPAAFVRSGPPPISMLNVAVVERGTEIIFGALGPPIRIIRLDSVGPEDIDIFDQCLYFFRTILFSK
jgi:hypothetical protein